MKTRHLLFLTFFFLPADMFSQQLDHFSPLECSGKIPEDFLMHTMDKVKRDIANIPYKEKYADREAKQEFLLNSNYELDELLLSGRVLFNDPISNYVSKVADVVLAGNPALRGKLRFYCLKTNEVNAFSTNPGIICITTGLMSKLKNEAQLAFIISHEIIHYKNKHPINLYVKEQNVLEKGKYQFNTIDERIRTISRFSKDNEMEADQQGFQLFSTSGYKLNEAITVLDLLLYSDLSFNNDKFDYSFLEYSGMKIPSYYIGREPIVFKERDKDYDDLRSSHPNMRTRNRQIHYQAQGMELGKGDLFKVSEKDFNYCRELCRFETVKLNLDRFEYTDAVYQASGLLKTYPGNPYLEDCLAKAIYAIAKFKNNSKDDCIHSEISETDPQGYMVSAYQFFNNFTSVQMNAVALRYLIRINEKLKFAFLDMLIKDLVKDLESHHNVTMDTLIAWSKVPLYVSSDTAHRIVKPILPKGNEDDRPQRINAHIQNETGVSKNPGNERENFHYHAFDDILGSPSLADLFSQVKKELYEEQTKQKELEEQYNRLSSYEKLRLYNKNEKMKERESYHISKLVIIDPYYLAADERKGVKRINSEDKQIDFNKQITIVAEAAGYDVDLISSKKLQDTSTRFFNDLGMYNEWMAEKINLKTDDMIPLNTEYALQLAQRYNTDYVCFTGVLTLKEIKEGRGFALIYSFLFPPVLPVVVPWLFVPKHETLYYVLLYNIRTGQVVLKKSKQIPVKARKGYINSMIYELLLRVKN